MKSTYEKRWGHPRTRKATHPRRQARRMRAQQRKAERDALIHEQKLAEIRRIARLTEPRFNATPAEQD